MGLLRNFSKCLPDGCPLPSTGGCVRGTVVPSPTPHRLVLVHRSMRLAGDTPPARQPPRPPVPSSAPQGLCRFFRIVIPDRGHTPTRQPPHPPAPPPAPRGPCRFFRTVIPDRGRTRTRQPPGHQDRHPMAGSTRRLRTPAR